MFKTVTDSKDLANKSVDYFSSVGNKLAKIIKYFEDSFPISSLFNSMVMLSAAEGEIGYFRSKNM